MHNDVDVAVIGAGPAGLAAAIRARWVRTAPAVPASVALIDPAGAGGIARLGRICLTGPGFASSGEELIGRLLCDIRELEIPLLLETALRLRRVYGYWQIDTDSRTLRATAVILAIGLRRLTGEAAVLAQGRLRFLAGGYQHAAQTFREWSDTHINGRLLLVGGAALSTDFSIFTGYDSGRNQLDMLIEPVQRICRYEVDDDGVRVFYDDNGVMRDAVYDCVMLDYHSLELAPPAPAFLPPALRRNGYCRVGPRGASRFPGLFAAGDCAGTPSLCLKALAQGVEAGLQAYRYVHTWKYGEAPQLFAFYASPERPPLTTPALPDIDLRHHTPVGLVADSAFPPLFHAGETDAESTADMSRLAEELLRKTATVHRR